MKLTPNNLQEIREDLGLSQIQLGRMIGASGPQVNRLEKGQRKLTLEWLLKICQALKIPAHDIVDLPAPPDETPEASAPCDEALLSSILIWLSEETAQSPLPPTVLATLAANLYNESQNLSYTQSHALTVSRVKQIGAGRAKKPAKSPPRPKSKKSAPRTQAGNTGQQEIKRALKAKRGIPQKKYSATEGIIPLRPTPAFCCPSCCPKRKRRV